APGIKKVKIAKRSQIGNVIIALLYMAETAVLMVKKRSQESHEKPLETQLKATGNPLVRV
ncbi:MAG TPA: hypothetical protein VG347_11615, partial [Verrucomicrobiae bacterium]|nr:hypothetical protein [Verrucomicrobiae bacterium]